MSEEHSTREDGSVFTYTFSARQREEIRAIQRKYLPREEDKMEQLRRLDRSVTKKATAASLAVGIVGTLVMGTGMSMTMVFAPGWFVPGIVIGVLGMIVLGMAYPLYTLVLKKERARVAPEILRLSGELLK